MLLILDIVREIIRKAQKKVNIYDNDDRDVMITIEAYKFYPTS